MKKIVVYQYILKEDKFLYAFTADKNLKDEFELERNMNLFYKKKKKMTENQFKSFSFMFNDSMLFCNTLFDGEHDLYFATTYKENFILEDQCRKIEDDIIDINRKLSQFPLNSKTKELLDTILEYAGDGLNESIYRFDTFKIFFNLCNNAII